MKIGLVCSFFVLLLTSCSKEAFYENIYEGVRMQKQLDEAGSEDAGEDQMPYRQYEAERQKSAD